jgi:hypothetical protein
MDSNRRISSFKKFTELNEDKKEENIESSDSIPVSDVAGTPVPNIPQDSTKVPVVQDTRYMQPEAQSPKGVDYKKVPNAMDEKKLQLIGKVARLPKGVKAHKGLNFMENIKIPKSSIWYIMVEKQDNELQMLKYNLTKGVDLSKFINELKSYYAKKFVKNPKLVESINSIEIDGNDKYSWIKNIPYVEVEGKKMISILTEDLIKLLSK